MAASTEKYKYDSDPLSSFVKMVFEIDASHTEWIISQEAAYQAYLTWCHVQELKVHERLSFRRFIEKFGKWAQYDETGTPLYRGLRYAQGSEKYQSKSIPTIHVNMTKKNSK